MLRKGYVFLLVVFLCKTLTRISCNSGNNAPAGESEQIFPMVEICFSPSFTSSLPSGAGSAQERAPASCKRYLPLPPRAGCPLGWGPPAVWALHGHEPPRKQGQGLGTWWLVSPRSWVWGFQWGLSPLGAPPGDEAVPRAPRGWEVTCTMSEALPASPGNTTATNPSSSSSQLQGEHEKGCCPPAGEAGKG